MILSHAKVSVSFFLFFPFLTPRDESGNETGGGVPVLDLGNRRLTGECIRVSSNMWQTVVEVRVDVHLDNSLFWYRFIYMYRDLLFFEVKTRMRACRSLLIAIGALREYYISRGGLHILYTQFSSTYMCLTTQTDGKKKKKSDRKNLFA